MTIFNGSANFHNSKTSAGRVGRPPGAAADSTEMLFDVHGVSHRE